MEFSNCLEHGAAFISAPENVAWTLNIRGGDGPNSPIPNSRLIVSKSKKILLVSNQKKCNQLLKRVSNSFTH